MSTSATASVAYVPPDESPATTCCATPAQSTARAISGSSGSVAELLGCEKQARQGHRERSYLKGTGGTEEAGGRGRRSHLIAEVRASDGFVALQRRAGPVDHDPPDLEHVGAARRREREARVLLHGEHGQPLVLVQLADDVVEAGDDERREPERRLVEQQEARTLHERPRQRELLLLAAAQRPGRLPAPLGEDRKAPQHALAVGLDAGTVPSHVRAEAEVLLYGQLRECAAPLGHV